MSGEVTLEVLPFIRNALKRKIVKLGEESTCSLCRIEIIKDCVVYKREEELDDIIDIEYYCRRCVKRFGTTFLQDLLDGHVCAVESPCYVLHMTEGIR